MACLDELISFDEVVVATGARYRWGLEPLMRGLLASGLARAWPLRRLLSTPAVRNWFYYRARLPTGALWILRLPGTVKVTVIGDAAKAGKSREAIASAFNRAFGIAQV